MSLTKSKASELFSPQELTRIQTIIELFDAKVVAVLDTPRDYKGVKAQNKWCVYELLKQRLSAENLSQSEYIKRIKKLCVDLKM